MNKITESDLLDYVSDVGEFDKTFRKYSSFYCSSTLLIKQENIDEIFKYYEADVSDFLNVRITRTGMWDDSNGTDWYDVEYVKVEEYEEVVPEVVIPSHTIIKERAVPFKPEFEE